MSMILESLQVQTRPGITGNAGSVGNTVFTADLNGVKATSPYKLMQDANLIHDKVQIPTVLVAATVSSFVFLVREGRWQLDGVTVYFQTGSTSGTLNVSVDTGTNAPGAGTAQLSSTISLAAAAQQTQLNGTLITTPTVAGPGDRFSVVIAGTMTSLANGMANISIKRVA